MQMTFKETKKLALSCSDKNRGRCVTGNFRLWYDKDNEEVSLIERAGNKETLFTIYPDDSAIIKGKNIDISHYHKLQDFLDVYAWRIPKSKRISGCYISGSKSDKNYIHVPGKTIIKNSRVVGVSDYTKYNIDTEWNKDFIKRNREFRGKIGPMLKFVETLKLYQSMYTEVEAIIDIFYKGNYSAENVEIVKKGSSYYGYDLTKYIASIKFEVARRCQAMVKDTIEQKL